MARSRITLAAAAVVAALVLPAATAGAAPAENASVAVIVRGNPGGMVAAERAVERVGGRVVRELGIIDGVAAEVPAGAVAALGAQRGVAGVTRDDSVAPQGASYSATADGGSMLNVTRLTGAQQYWAKGYTGKGIDVAVLDSGVAPVDGLRAPGKVLQGPDLSFESQDADLAHLDTFGHGTHMAGIIAGRADAAVPGTYTTDTTNFVGMAPDARIISLKLADARGQTDVSQVIAAIDWVVQHRNDPGMNIRVLNLSYGTDSTNDYKVDPLAYAAEQAWKAGIFVVAAAGNAGFVSMSTGSLTMPAKDPNIMAVGAVDTVGTATLQDDKIPAYSSAGSTGRRLDLVAPGSHIASLRVPGSLIDTTYASTGAVSDQLFRGSGTSQATAVVSGAAALVLQERPTTTPAQLKALLLGSAYRLPGATIEAQGKGELDLAKALATKTPTAATFSATASTGTGSLDAARGTQRISADGVALTGERDIFGATWDSRAMASLTAAQATWNGGTWNGTDWTGRSWTGSTWTGSSWTGRSWTGRSWTDASWSSNTWTGRSWTTGAWTSTTWSGRSWTGNVWADAIWG